MPRATAQLVTLVKIKNYYVPTDESYRILRRRNIASVRFTEEFVHSLKMLKGLKFHVVPFAEIIQPAFEKLARNWTSNSLRRIKIVKGEIRLDSRDVKRVAITFPEVERGLKKFFTRWGIDCSFEFSETATRAKLVVQFRFNKDTLPMIKVRDDG